MSKPNVLRFDTLDDRRQLAKSLLPSLLPDVRLQFLEWACELTWRVSEKLRASASHVRPDYKKMGPVVRKARMRSDEANKLLTNMVYLDLCFLSHEYGVDFLAILTELENWAKGRERTPAPYAAVALLQLEAARRISPV